MRIKWIDVPVSDDRQETIGLAEDGAIFLPANLCSSKMSALPPATPVVHAARGAFVRDEDFLKAYPYAAGIIQRLLASAGLPLQLQIAA